MVKHSQRPVYTAGIIERSDSRILIALPSAGEYESRLWQFPRGPVAANESPEAAMRRVAKEMLGIFVEIVVGQPPLIESVGGRDVELRYFFCAPGTGEAAAGPYAEIRWVVKAHLCEYDFDAASQPVCRWLLEH